MTSVGPKPAIVKTSPSKDGSLHPRRAPAQQSVSLRHSPSKQLDSTSSGRAEASSSDDSPSSLVPLHGKGSSGETSNAENWFDKSNNEVRDTSASFADNDPPFFMRNSSSETPPEGQPLVKHLINKDRASSLPLRTGLLRLGTDGSSTEDYRSVIDDLTIENKKLKKKLKTYEKLHDSHLKDERLFEVRIHGLPAEKKRELEETLRKFAASLDTTGPNAFPSGGYASLVPMLKTSKTSSSQASVQNTDSAYASMSASGQGSSGQSSGLDGKRRRAPSAHLASQRQSIHNYLHHIPEGLMPQENPATLSEKAKKKLVVRRMEQLFAGKGAAAVSHQHSLQQQEVSQSAAKADRSAIEASGQRARLEGNREAHIMQKETEDPLDFRQGKRPEEENSVDDTLKPTRKYQPARSPGHEQRPTRPLDLDPHRAQIPAENIEYMRHLGFSPADPSATGSPEQGHGWIYLNFLINMAQLHTINVTSDFVRKALSEYSDKFEISADLRKVRWRGGRSVTRTSSSSGRSAPHHPGDDTPDGQSPRKRRKRSHGAGGQSAASRGLQSGRGSLQQPTEGSKHMYTPLFFHRDSTEDSDDSSSEVVDDNMSSPLPDPLPATSSGMTSSGIRTNSGVPLGAAKKKKQKQDNGPIIFYNNARFCTDLSGDSRPNSNVGRVPAYTSAGVASSGDRRSPNESTDERRGPLAETSELPEPMSLQDNPIPDSMELAFPENSPMGSDSSTDQQPIALAVTGIGGVWPTDNFAISVHSRHAEVDQSEAPTIANAGSKALPARIAEILHGSGAKPKTRSASHKQYIATKLKQLPPAELPAALSYMGGDPAYDDDDEDMDSDFDESMSDAPGSDDDLPPSAAPQPVDLHYTSEDDEHEEDDEDDDDDDDDEDSDGEVDFLATARRIDPEAVRQQEREYDANMAERLAEEIPAGSSAATAGGGSGFASPATGVTAEEHKRASKGARAKAANASHHAALEAEKTQDVSSDEDSDEKMSVSS